MNDLRESLDREAGRVRADLGALEQVRRRADRHHRIRRITAGAVAVIVVVAGFAGVVGALNTGGSGVADGSDWRAIWPQQSLKEGQTAQERANAEDERLTWQRNAAEFVWRFGNDGLSWVLTETSWTGVPTGSKGADETAGPVTLTLRGAPADECTHDDEWTCPDGAFVDAQLTIERLLQRDENGIWFVTGVVVDGQQPDIENSPLPDATPQPGGQDSPTAPAATEAPHEVTEFVTAFMTSRQNVTEFAKERLSDEAAIAYHADNGPDELNLYDAYVGAPGSTWTIMKVSVFPNTDRWRVIVRIAGTGEAFPESGRVHETLVVGSPGDGAPYVVLTAQRFE